MLTGSEIRSVGTLPHPAVPEPCASPPAENLPNRRFPVRRRQPEHRVVHPLVVRPAGLPRRRKPREGTVHRQLQVGNVTVCSSAETVAGFFYLGRERIEF